METYLINSIYKATEGEGIFIGTPQVFVRFQGCRVGCLNCDSMDTWSFDEGDFWSLDSILNEISSYGLKRVSITGGDPLHPKHYPAVLRLTQKLKERGYSINIEASGTRIEDTLFDLVDFISFDFKTPSTGVKVSPKLFEKLVCQYQGKYQIKSVVENEEDFIASLELFNYLKEKFPENNIPWALTPAYNFTETFPELRFKNVLKWNEEKGGPFRVIGQQHKWIFGPKTKKV